MKKLKTLDIQTLGVLQQLQSDSLEELHEISLLKDSI
jgi:hypothetical protein